MTTLAPDIFRQRLLIEGYYDRDVDEGERKAVSETKRFFKVGKMKHKPF